MRKGPMPTTAKKKILEELALLPLSLQEEALDFIDYLRQKQSGGSSETSEWNQFSLESALSGIEDDAFPAYKESDLKEIWK